MLFRPFKLEGETTDGGLPIGVPTFILGTALNLQGAYSQAKRQAIMKSSDPGRLQKSLQFQYGISRV
jgi:hypothetical protein